jgi:glycosyltransferase involved in cell wall biosynthesis
VPGDGGDAHAAPARPSGALHPASLDLRVVLASTSDLEGGAARAAFRLLQGLVEVGVDAQLLVQHRSSDRADVHGPTSSVRRGLSGLRQALDSAPLAFYPRRERTIFSPATLPNPRVVGKLSAADVVHLHWITGGFLRIEAIGAIKRPMVWTLHDSWAFTGGCHVSFECEGFTRRCGRCPNLHSTRERDLSRWVWRRKARAWERSSFAVVAGSRWMAERAKQSSLFAGRRIEVIPPGLDLRAFRPIEKTVARDVLGLPRDARLVLFGAMSATSDRNKGFHLFKPALARVAAMTAPADVRAVVFGASEPRNPEPLGMPVHYVGRLHDDVSLALLYSAADVMVVPSLQEAFAQTATEAMSCGTPVVAFGATGLLDVVDHELNGYLARPYEVEDLARGIAWVLSDDERRARLSREARAKCERALEYRDLARRYAALYASIAER